jgi:ribonuclease E
VEEAPRRNRRARGRVRQAEEPDVATSEASPVEVVAATEPVVDSAPEAAAEPETPPAPARRSRARKAPASTVTETVEPIASVAEPEPVSIEPPPAPVEPDPAEISGPPPAPKRGWWRRG